jgi:hypothetical protein
VYTSRIFYSATIDLTARKCLSTYQLVSWSRGAIRPGVDGSDGSCTECPPSADGPPVDGPSFSFFRLRFSFFSLAGLLRGGDEVGGSGTGRGPAAAGRLRLASTATGWRARYSEYTLLHTTTATPHYTSARIRA